MVSDLDEQPNQESPRPDESRSPSPIPLETAAYYRQKGAGIKLDSLLPPLLPPIDIVSNHDGRHYELL